MNRDEFFQKICSIVQIISQGKSRLRLSENQFILLLYYMVNDCPCTKSASEIISDLNIKPCSFTSSREYLLKKNLIFRNVIKNHTVCQISVNYIKICDLFYN